MTGYLIHFSIYTLAMIGIIFAALFVFKNFSLRTGSKKNGKLQVEESLNLSSRKTLHIVKVGNERFLIASDIDRTTLISKLGVNSSVEDLIEKDERYERSEKIERIERIDRSEELSSYDGIESLNDFASILNFNRKNSSKKPMMRELARKLGTM